MNRKTVQLFHLMRSAEVSSWLAIAFVLLSSAARGAPAVEEAAPGGPISRPDGDGSEGAKAVQALLAKTYPKEGWANGPAQIDSDAIRKAYPSRKFYYVFSPSYPVARVGQISAVAAITILDGKDAEPVLVSTPADFSEDLAKFESEDDAKTSAAAILSLVMTWRGPLAVTAEEITAKKTKAGGWQCTATRGVPKPAEGPDGIGSGIYFYADFSAEGKCTRAEIDDRNPRPICIGGLFWPVSLPQDVSAEVGFARGGGLLTASVEPDSIASRAGLQAGDTIIAFADKPLPIDDTIQQMRQVVYPLKQRGNAQRSLVVLRGGQQVRLTLRW